MDPAALELLSHAGPHAHGPGAGALAALAIGGMVLPLLVLGVIGRAFWRASKRDAAAARPPEDAAPRA